MTEIELKTPWGDTVILRKSGDYTVAKWGDGDEWDRFPRMHQISNWLNLEWWPTVFSPDWYQLRVEDISELPEKI